MNVRTDNTTASSCVSTPSVDLPASVQQASASIVWPAEVKRTFRSQQKKETLHYLKTQASVWKYYTFELCLIVCDYDHSKWSKKQYVSQVCYLLWFSVVFSVFTQILMNVCLSRVCVACRASVRIQWAASAVSVHRASDWTLSVSTVMVRICVCVYDWNVAVSE